MLTITPGFGIDHTTPRTFLRGYVAVPILLYARTGDTNNEVLPLVDLTGNAEIIKDFFFVDASANVQQTFYNPFGQRPADLTSATENRVQTQTYRVVPYIRGTLGGTTSYELRDENVWTILDDAPFEGTTGTRLNTSTASSARSTANRRRSAGARTSSERVKFEDQERDQYTELARLRGVYQSSPSLQLYVTGGYEDNRVPCSTESDGAIYGGRLPLATDRPHAPRRLRRAPLLRHVLCRDLRPPHAADHVDVARVAQHRVLPRGARHASRRRLSSPASSNQLFLNRIPDQRERAVHRSLHAGSQSSAVRLRPDRAVLAAHRSRGAVSGTVSVLGARNTCPLGLLRTRPRRSLPKATSCRRPFVLREQQRSRRVGDLDLYARSNSSLTLSAEGRRDDGQRAAGRRVAAMVLSRNVNRAISPRTHAGRRAALSGRRFRLQRHVQ